MAKRREGKKGGPPPPPGRRQPPGRVLLEAADVLAEFPGDTGLLLWRAVRAVHLWATTPLERRPALFSPRAFDRFTDDLAAVPVDPALRMPLGVVGAVFADPASRRLPHVADGCRVISEWAEKRGALATSLEFAQAAAVAEPGKAAPAYAVGRLARRLAEYPLAESWYLHARRVARRTEEWRVYAEACAGLGVLHQQQGNFALARRHHLRALHVSRRRSLRQMEAAALHNLFAVSLELGAMREAEAYALRALQAYGPRNHMLPRLVYDVVYFWLLNGCFEPALEVAMSLTAHFERPSELLLLHGAIARAAGGVGERETYERARAQIERLAEWRETREHLASGLLGLAHGAASLGEWEEVARSGRRVVEVASERQQTRLVREAEALLQMAG